MRFDVGELGMCTSAGYAVIRFCAVDIADGRTVVVYCAVEGGLLAGLNAVKQRERGCGGRIGGKRVDGFDRGGG